MVKSTALFSYLRFCRKEGGMVAMNEKNAAFGNGVGEETRRGGCAIK